VGDRAWGYYGDHGVVHAQLSAVRGQRRTQCLLSALGVGADIRGDVHLGGVELRGQRPHLLDHPAVPDDQLGAEIT